MRIVLILVVIIVVVLVFDAARMYLLFRKTLALEHALPFSRTMPGATMRILVLGDSTAVGTGASRPEDSTAGRLAALYPQAELVNISRNGLKIAGLLDKLSAIDSKEHFDIVLIQIGANDIIQLTSTSNMRTGLDRVLSRAEQFGGKVIVLHSANIGESTFFPWYLRLILSKKSLAVREMYKKVTATHNAYYVDLIGSSVGKIFEHDPANYYANDLLHLSSDGYRLWFDEIRKGLPPNSEK